MQEEMEKAQEEINEPRNTSTTVGGGVVADAPSTGDKESLLKASP